MIQRKLVESGSRIEVELGFRHLWSGFILNFSRSVTTVIASNFKSNRVLGRSTVYDWWTFRKAVYI